MSGDVEGFSRMEQEALRMEARASELLQMAEDVRKRAIEYRSTDGQSLANDMFGLIKGNHTIEDDVTRVNFDENGMRAGQNCTFCSISYDLRRRGFDCQAITQSSGAFGNFGNTFVDLTMQYATSYSPFDAADEIARTAESWGAGARGIITIGWDRNNVSGHAFNFEVDDTGKCLFIDAQTGTTNARSNFEMAYQGTVMFARTDDKQVTKNIISTSERRFADGS